MKPVRALSLSMFAILLCSCLAQKPRPIDIRSIETAPLTQADMPFARICKTAIQSPVTVSVSELLSNPSQYEARAVSVTGYYLQGRSGARAIFQDKARYTKGLFSDGIWLDSPLSGAADGDKVSITGIFTSTLAGSYYGAFDAGICIH